MTGSMKKAGTAVIILVALFTINSCDSRAIDPFENIEGLYSVYGALQIYNSEHYVRVRRLDTPLLADSTSFNGIVKFTNLETGETTVLQDSIVNFNGNYTHNFRIDELILPEQQYKIEVESPEGEITESIATAPRETSYSLSPDPGDPDTTLTCRTEIDFQFDNVVEPEFVRMDVGFNHNGRMHWTTLSEVDQLEYSPNADRMTVTMSPHHFLIEVFTPPLPDDISIDLKNLNPTVSCGQLQNRQVYIRYYHFGIEWDQALPIWSGNIDIESEDVINGLGFFGAYYTGEFTIPFTLN